ALTTSWTPLSEVNVDVTTGYDIVNRRNFSFSPYHYDIDEFTTNNPLGSRSIGSAMNRLLTLGGKVAWNRPLTSTITSALVAATSPRAKPSPPTSTAGTSRKSSLAFTTSRS